MRTSIVATVIATAAGAAAAQGRHEFTAVHMGMAVRVIVHAADDSTARGAAGAAFDRIAALEDKMSDWRSGSEVGRLGLRPLPVSAELFAVLERALAVARASGGAFDPSLGPYVALWRETRRTGRLPSDSTLADARSRVGWRLVVLDTVARSVRLAVAGMRLDLGGIAKGYILGAALATLRARGITAALIEAGGDIVVGDPPPGRPGWIVAIGGVDTAVASTAVSTSGTGAQFVAIGGVRYAHVVDPRTGLGVTSARTVTVVGPDPAITDALATALVVLGSEDGAAVAARFPEYRVRWRD